ncbi:BolA/IbaG family iron-sulfur metabolism protein [Bdellovibrionota bacterium FG-1]
MTPAQIKERIELLAPGTQAEVMDLTGTYDHYQAVVVSPAFAGKMMMEQHRMIYGLFKAEMESNEVHALSLKTFTPEQYEKFTR